MDVAKIVTIVVLAVLVAFLIGKTIDAIRPIAELGTRMILYARQGQVSSYGIADPVQLSSVPLAATNALAPGGWAAIGAFLWIVPTFTVIMFIFKVAVAVLG